MNIPGPIGARPALEACLWRPPGDIQLLANLCDGDIIGPGDACTFGERLPGEAIFAGVRAIGGPRRAETDVPEVALLGENGTREEAAADKRRKLDIGGSGPRSNVTLSSSSTSSVALSMKNCLELRSTPPIMESLSEDRSWSCKISK